MKNKNDLCIAIARKIWNEGSATRPELIRWSGVRPATLFGTIDLLKERGLICEPGRTGKYIGRKASEIFPAQNCFWTVGIDFQDRRTIGVIVDLSGKIHHRVEFPASQRGSLAACQQEIEALLNRLKRDAGEDWKKVQGIGFADPGLVNVRQGISLAAVNIPAWNKVNTGEWLRQTTGLEAGVWPECYVKTYMEYNRSFRENGGSLFLLEMDNGVGGGFFKDGTGFIGDSDQAMEIGHIIIDPKGPLCQCGSRGCLEAFIGEKGIRRRIQEAIDSGVHTALDGKEFSFESFTLCAQYDKLTRMLAVEASESVGRALAVVVALLNPSVIVLSGKLTGLGELLMASVHRMLNLSCFSGAVENMQIKFSTLAQDDTAKGAALLIRERLLSALFDQPIR